MAASSSPGSASCRNAEAQHVGLVATYNIGATSDEYCCGKKHRSPFEVKLGQDLEQLLKVCCDSHLEGFLDATTTMHIRTRTPPVSEVMKSNIFVIVHHDLQRKLRAKLTSTHSVLALVAS